MNAPGDSNGISSLSLSLTGMHNMGLVYFMSVLLAPCNGAGCNPRVSRIFGFVNYLAEHTYLWK